MTSPIASVERAAMHRNGRGSEPFISVFFTNTEGDRLHALLFAEVGRAAVFALDDPGDKLSAGIYEADLRAAVVEIGFPYDMRGPLEGLHERAQALLDSLRVQRDAASVPTKLRAVARHVEGALHSLARAIERNNA